jgi:hypothetical protein
MDHLFPSFCHFKDDGHVSVSEDLLSLRFNLQIGSMYLEQDMYSPNEEMYETILIKKTEPMLVFCGS